VEIEEILPVFGDVQELTDVKVVLLLRETSFFHVNGVLHQELAITDQLLGFAPPETNHSKLLNIMVNVAMIRCFLTLPKVYTLTLISDLE
jgi:hypothetical protein